MASSAFFEASAACLLGLVVDEDRRRVLETRVAELAARVRRVDVVPEDVEELLVGHLLRIEDDLDRLAVSRPARPDFVVRRARLRPARVPDGRRDDAGQGIVGTLHAPEAAPGERGLREAGGGGSRGLRPLVCPREGGEQQQGEERQEKTVVAAHGGDLRRGYGRSPFHGCRKGPVLFPQRTYGRPKSFVRASATDRKASGRPAASSGENQPTSSVSSPACGSRLPGASVPR